MGYIAKRANKCQSTEAGCKFSMLGTSLNLESISERVNGSEGLRKSKFCFRQEMKPFREYWVEDGHEVGDSYVGIITHIILPFSKTHTTF